MLEPIPHHPDFKEKFEEHYIKLFGEEYEEFKKYSTSYIKKSIRVNTNKKSVKEIQKRLNRNWNLRPVPWCKEGFWIDYKNEEKRFDIGNTPEHQLGYIYDQDAASMIPPVVLDPIPGEIVLDMCAAPGSKTSQMAQYMKNKGLLIANDIAGDRLKALGLNLQRCGITNTIITQHKGHHFRKLQFDKILLDAPCSGTGTLRRSFKIMNMWGANLVHKMASIQRQLILAAFEGLKPGGEMVYSTCTMEPEENEAVVSYLLRKKPEAQLQDIDLDIKRREPILAFENLDIDPRVKKCLRIAPQDNDSEGFFVCKIKKITAE